MRKRLFTAALGCLAMATAADAQLPNGGPSPCAYGAADQDLVFEVAIADRHGTSGPLLA